MSERSSPPVRVRARVEGTVQGVGFRPFVYRLARELGLAGWVRNDARGVLAEVQGPASDVDRFLARLVSEAPPLAVVERVSPLPRPLAGERGFAIHASARADAAGAIDVPVTPDCATCDDCLRELLDPLDRRFRYPFVNCTNCGPRFTIVRGIPYDRPLTTMAGFVMCDACQAEYDDPGDRRFHAQPNACPDCGPAVALLDAGGAALAVRDEAMRACAAALREGAIVAVKGIGGYHLACRADDQQVVARLRSRKHREDRPFALMAASLDEVRRLVELGETERALLLSPARPIVLAPRLAGAAGAAVAAAVAPGAVELGVMLPYSPLHHLLLADAAVGPLVMTSGNVADEPIAFGDEDGVERLLAGGIAELMLTHDRPIETRTDDSVVRAVRGRAQFLRRSRGCVPAPLRLPGGTARPLLACGAELKHAFCLARGERAWVSHHIGDLRNYETLQSFTDGARHFEALFEVTPEVVAHDLHPDYLSTRYALERDGVALVAVQHHHAHLAGCLAEHGFGPDTRAVGAIFDGTGYGTDGTVWGGEILFGGASGFERLGSLPAVPLPGGELAIREPWRMALAWLDADLSEDPVVPGDPGVLEDPPSLGHPALPGPLAGQVDPRRWAQVLAASRARLNSPLTTSAGRLFDAVAALCGIRPQVNYEGQAAIELEAACDPAERGYYAIEALDPRAAIRAIVADLERGVPVGVVAARFHNGIARAVVDACAAAASARGVELVVLSGGVFQNRRLLEGALAGLEAAGLRALTPVALPVGDGGIAFGQAAVAAAAQI